MYFRMRAWLMWEWFDKILDNSKKTNAILGKLPKNTSKPDKYMVSNSSQCVSRGCIQAGIGSKRGRSQRLVRRASSTTGTILRFLQRDTSSVSVMKPFGALIRNCLNQMQHQRMIN
jgi:hypothetical protein